MPYTICGAASEPVVATTTIPPTVTVLPMTTVWVPITMAWDDIPDLEDCTLSGTVVEPMTTGATVVVLEVVGFGVEVFDVDVLVES